MTGTLLILGHGYSAAALSRRLLPQGWTVIGTTRSAEKAETLRATGVEPLIWPGAPLQPALARATHLLAGIGPVPEGDPVLAAHGTEIEAAAPHLAWAGYLSTTGVYGDHAGGWVDEDTPLAPSTARGQARLEAEEAWQQLAARTGLALHIFRLAGIYGPGRGPFRKVMDGTARLIIRENQFMSRVHVDDIAAVLEASIKAPAPGGVYNVCDDEPTSPEEVLIHAARLLGLPPPPRIPFDEAPMSAMARSFYAESKKVRNDRIRTELGVHLAYPTYREGLAAMRAAMSDGGDDEE
ncbi:SDR family oxidoreductase [Frigidibacter sp. RF13]|uniref:SDR family oxidoreductase n=1 Tax=Frigidibacter sp. RF13 TaxID=2997340 RepID=UPI00226F4551|nr:SDR family oxidoreductase [Frigidibacter sp. RF13]MCY1126654.1 SDR family oxidoreductase [Frigidibacter sp. RF13]